jgi:peptidylprolyl isomerase
MTFRSLMVAAAALSVSTLTVGAHQTKSAPAPAAKTIIVLDTVKGPIEIELFTADAPKTTAHVLGLAKKGFYRGFRFHRVEKSLVQIGDPQSKNVAMEAYWGQGSSGTPVGVAEISKKHPHVRGAVGMANSGDARYSDSQFYIMKAASPSLDGKYTVIGTVIKGMDIVDRLQKRDVMKNILIKGADQK